MQMKTKKFEFEGYEFEVRALPFPDGWKVKVFCDNKLVSPVIYSVEYDTQMDMKMTTGYDAIDALMALAQTDIENKIVKIFIR